MGAEDWPAEISFNLAMNLFSEFEPVLQPVRIDLAVKCFFGGGGGAPKAPKQQNIDLPPAPNYQVPAMPALPPMPPPPPPPPPPDPPVSSSALDVQQSMDQQRIDAQKRKGMRATLIAGESNQKPASPVTGQTLLG